MDRKIRVLINIWCGKAEGKKLFGVKGRLDSFADWQVLKEFSFGTLAWDYEEGFKFETTPAQLSEFSKWARSLNLSSVDASLTMHGPGLPVFEQEFLAAGFKKGKISDWTLGKEKS